MFPDIKFVVDKIDGFKSDDAEHMRLGKVYKWARELARTYGPVIAASQLSASAEELRDPPFIGLDALRGSKTDKPGEADAVITIGKYKEPKSEEEEKIRTINVPKKSCVCCNRFDDFDDSRNKARRKWRRCSNANLTSTWIGKKLNVLHPLA